MRSEVTVVFDGPASPALTLSPLRRGRGDPCYHVASDGAIWRTSLMRSGPVTARITRSAPDTVDCEAWGSGTKEFAETLPAQLGADDDPSGFAPEEPTIAEAYRRAPSAPGPHRPGGGIAHPRRHRTAGFRHGRAQGVARTGHQVRVTGSRAGAHPSGSNSAGQYAPALKPDDKKQQQGGDVTRNGINVNGDLNIHGANTDDAVAKLQKEQNRGMMASWGGNPT